MNEEQEPEKRRTGSYILSSHVWQQAEHRTGFDTLLLRGSHVYLISMGEAVKRIVHSAPRWLSEHAAGYSRDALVSAGPEEW